MCDKVCVNKLGLRNCVRTTTCPSQVMKAVVVAAAMMKKPASEETAVVVAPANKKKPQYDIDAGDTGEEEDDDAPGEGHIADKNMKAWIRKFEGGLHQALCDIGG